MLYVSRRVGKKYAIMDTDDNVEQLASASELLHMVRRLGLDIKGCDFLQDGDRRKFSVRIYAPEQALQLVKLRTLAGVDLTVRDRILYSVIFGNRAMDVSIVLSDICDSIDDTIFYGTTNGKGAGIITFVLDDNVKFRVDKSFLGVRYFTFVRLDIRGITSDEDAEWVYGEYTLPKGGTYSKIGFPIIDNSYRYNKHVAEQVLRMSLRIIIDIPDDVKAMEDYVLSRYKERFMRYKDVRHIANLPDNISIRDMGILLQDYSFLNKDDIVMLTNYMLYWGNDKDVQSVWYE